MAKRKTTKKGKVDMANSDSLSFRIEQDTAQRAKEMAEAEGLTLTQVMKALMRGFVTGKFVVGMHVGAGEQSENDK